jgi:hypothetical protein
MFTTRSVLVASLILSFSIVPALADDSGWVSGYKAFNQFLIKRNKNFFPTKIECRDSKKADYTEGNAEYRVTYIETDNVKFYRWGVGGGFGEAKAIAAREGLKLISSDQFTRAKSGLVVRCGIWAEG